MIKLSKTSAVPIYEQVAANLSDKIVDRVLEPGTQLPPEEKLAREYGVSRVTIRSVLARLSNKGLVIRRKGKGTFVADHNAKPFRNQFGILYFGRNEAISNLFFSTIFSGIKTELETEQPISIINWHDGVDLTMLDEFKVLFLVYASSASVDDLKKLTSCRAKLIYISSFHMDYPNVYSVTVDNFHGAYDATKLLLENGHQRIAFVANSPGNSAYYERLKGYKKALKEYGIPFDQKFIANLNNSISADEEKGYEEAEKILSLAIRPTAFFAANDYLAIGIIKALKDKGYAVPEDISVIGFDGLKVGNYFDPPLTTVKTEIDRIGREAVIMARRLLKGEKMEMKKTIPVELLIKKSVTEVSR